MKNILVTKSLSFIRSNFTRLLLGHVDCELVINLDMQTYAGNPEIYRKLRVILAMFLARGISVMLLRLKFTL